MARLSDVHLSSNDDEPANHAIWQRRSRSSGARGPRVGTSCTPEALSTGGTARHLPNTDARDLRRLLGQPVSEEMLPWVGYRTPIRHSRTAAWQPTSIDGLMSLGEPPAPRPSRIAKVFAAAHEQLGSNCQQRTGLLQVASGP